MLSFQNEYRDLECRYNQCVSELEQLKGRDQGAELHQHCETLTTDNLQLTRELDALRTQLSEREDRVRQEEKEKAASLEREVERLSEECSVVKDESTALRYQLSSANMELQQTKEVYITQYVYYQRTTTP